MDLNLTGKRVVVTGGSKGIGFAIAKEFLQEGAIVTITGRNQEDLDFASDELSKYGEIYGVQADGSKEEEVYKAAELAAGEEGRIDAWINNIGTNKPRQGELYTGEEVDYLVGACFKSAVFGSQAAYQYMKKSGGSIVNISSLDRKSVV